MGRPKRGETPKSRESERAIPLTPALVELMHAHQLDHPGGTAFRPGTAQLRTFVAPGRRTVMLDSSEVSAMLRAVSVGYRAPAYAAVREDLIQLADALDMQALQALVGTEGRGGEEV
ncbi:MULTISPECIES: hypothetical protein [Actinomycetes]|uniref:Uncharacterized protein n=1 Tax=Streptomyces acidiscabies TaxID=42234 RepID=A0AAP6EH05_9ACTN|nr:MULTISPECIES: hypothetical protein [Actinomycetes]MBP5938364.1 hypothetical protein [Streptomyces sp. LBUM 1476]MBZ3909458.1 hypothetical protein [Streptomyces acidiscabies]MDX2962374.1 hypothetical protein [Streptomyces acidiscabies]MDX2974704.1 hypothetical protein [Kribbella solani]MDX3019826.1 hypothetical protein [Streptomyces acidiscabies]